VDTAEADRGSVSLAAVLSSIARQLQAEPGVEATLNAIVKAALDHIAGAERAGISLVTRGVIHTVAPTDDLVTEIDRLQYETNEGPCVDAIDQHDTFVTGDLAAEKRWPRFAPEAVGRGIRSMLSYRLFVTETTMGALNLYSSQPDAFDPSAMDEGQLFASHAAVALIGAQHEAQLEAAIESRDLIGMAKGILMHQHDVDPATAFRLLTEASQASNMKLRDIAAWLVAHRREI